MQPSRIGSGLTVLFLLYVALSPFQPAAAAPAVITITYRGSGGNYIGDTIVFDGLNTAGNTTLIKITGPNLPAEGVPLYNLNGIPGSGNIVPVNFRNQWRFSWDMTRIDTSKLRTARYSFTAWDREKSEIRATTSLVLKQPEFYLKAKPAIWRTGDYFELEGMAEKGISYIRLDITSTAGTVLHTYITPVSGLGFFQHGFRIDMPPGQYNIVGTNPSMKKNLVLPLTVTEPGTTVPVTPMPDFSALPVETVTGTTDNPAPVTSAIPAPTRAGTISSSLVLTMMGAGTIAFWLSRK